MAINVSLIIDGINYDCIPHGGAALPPAQPPVTPPFQPGPTNPAQIPTPPSSTSFGAVVRTFDLMNPQRVVREPIAGDPAYSQITSYRVKIPSGYHGDCFTAVGETSGSAATYCYIWLSREPGGVPINPDDRFQARISLGTIHIQTPTQIPSGIEYWFNVAPDAAGIVTVHGPMF